MVYDFIFYTTTFIFAFYSFSHTNIIPKSLLGFGGGECKDLFETYPRKPVVPYFNEFYLY